MNNIKNIIPLIVLFSDTTRDPRKGETHGVGKLNYSNLKGHEF